MRIVVSDTSPLFYLARLGRLNALWQTYGRVLVPRTVWQELLASRNRYPAVSALLATSLSEGWIEIIDDTFDSLHLESTGLDAGEARAIALAVGLKADYLVIDEAAGRNIARRMGLFAVGTGGVLLEARLRGLFPH